MPEGKPDSDASHDARSVRSRFLLLALIEAAMLGVGALALVAEKTTIGIAMIAGGTIVGFMGVGTLIAARAKQQQQNQQQNPNPDRSIT